MQRRDLSNSIFVAFLFFCKIRSDIILNRTKTVNLEQNLNFSGMFTSLPKQTTCCRIKIISGS